MKHTHDNHANSSNITTNFRKAQSHINRILKMLDDDSYCVDVMQQNLAVIGLLKSAHQMLMEDHLNSCFSSAIQSNNDQTKSRMIEEILTVTKLANR